MSIESPQIGALKREQESLPALIAQRKVTLDRIGTGDIKLGSSMESTLKVGKVRKVVRKSIDRLEAKQENLATQIKGYEEAKDYLSQLPQKKALLDQLEEMAAEDDVLKEAYAQHKTEFDEFSSLPDRNPALKQGLEMLKREEESKVSKTEKAQQTPGSMLDNMPSRLPKNHLLRRVPADKEGIKATIASLNASVPGIDEQTDEATTNLRRIPSGKIKKVLKKLTTSDNKQQASSTEQNRVQESFTLPNGQEIEANGEVLKLLHVIANTSRTHRISAIKVAEALHEDKTAPQLTADQVRSLTRKANTALKDTSFRVDGIRGQKGGYYLVDESQPQETALSLPAAVVAPTQKKAEKQTKKPAEKDAVQDDTHYEMPEFGPLSRHDVALIASLYSGGNGERPHVQKAKKLKTLCALDALEELTGEKLKIVDRDVLLELTDYAELTAPQSTNAQESLMKQRVAALEKVKLLLKNPDYEATMEEVSQQDMNVWYLLENLATIENTEVSKTNGTTQSGIEFLQEWYQASENERGLGYSTERKVKTRIPRRLVESPKKTAPTKEKVVFSPKKAQKENPAVSEQPKAKQSQIAQESSRNEDGKEPEKYEIATFSQSKVDTNTHHDQNGIIVEPVTNTTQQEKQEILVAEDRTTVNPAENSGKVLPDEVVEKYIDEVAEACTLDGSYAGAQMNQLFPRLRRGLVDRLIKSKLIPAILTKNGDYSYLDAAGIATALFFHDSKNGNQLSGQKKKKVYSQMSREANRRLEKASGVSA